MRKESITTDSLPGESFRPGTSIARAETASMIDRAPVLPADDSDATSFDDGRGGIPAWARGAAATLSKFAPNNDTATRAEAVRPMMRLASKQPGRPLSS